MAFLFVEGNIAPCAGEVKLFLMVSAYPAALNLLAGAVEVDSCRKHKVAD